MRIKTQLLGLSLLAAGTFGASAELVDNYVEQFTDLDLYPTAEFAPPKWGRIVDSFDGVYVGYTNPSSGGYAGDWLSVGTPPLTGKVSFYLKKVSSDEVGSVKIYKATKAADGTYSVSGDPIKTIEDADLKIQWQQFEIADVAANTRLAFRMEKVGMDQFEAAQADVELEAGLKVKSAKYVTNPLTANAENKITVEIKATLTNSGELPLKAGDKNYSVSVLDYINSNDRPVIMTADVTQDLAVGATSDEISLKFTVDAGEKENRRFDVRENITGTSLMAGYLSVVPYLPKPELRPAGEETEEYTSAIDFGVLKDASVAKSFVVYNAGAAPLKVTALTVPEGYTSSVSAPFEVAAGASQALDITLKADKAGVYAGDITIAGEGVEAKTYKVIGTRVGADTYREDFEGEKFSANLITDSNWSLATTPAGLAYDGNARWAVASYSNTKLITPKLTVADGDKLVLYVAKRGSSSKMAVYYSPDRQNWTKVKGYISVGTPKEDEEEFGEAKDASGSSYYDDYLFQPSVISNIPAGDWYLAIESGYAKVADIIGYKLAKVNHDFFVKDLKLPIKGAVNTPYAATISLTNMNSVDEKAGGYAVKLYVDGEVVAEAEAPALAASATADYALTYYPHKTGKSTVYIEVSSADGYVMKTKEVDVDIAEESSYVEYTAGTATTTDTKGPINSYYKYSQTETVYAKSLLAGLENGSKLGKISYRGYSTMSKDVELNYKVYIANTDATGFETNTPTDVSTMTLVYDGTARIPTAGTSADPADLLEFQFTEPFVYEGNGLRVVVEQSGSDYKSAYFQVDKSKTGVSIVRYNDSDITTAKWGWNAGLPVANFFVVNTPATLSGKVNDKTTGAAVADAEIELVSGGVLYTGTSGADGSYSIPVIQSSRTYTMSVAAEGYKAFAQDGVAFESLAKTLDVVLEPDGVSGVASASVEGGYVVGGQGEIVVKAVANGEVSIYDVAGRLVRRAKVAEGENRISGLQRGIYFVGQRKVAVR